MKAKVLHTADWHIGKQLHKYTLEEDHRLFFDWLFQTIEEREIDLLLVSGDIFDTASPSHASLKLYYQFLTRLINHRCKIVITGGNHDSPGVLNAPKDILDHLDIHMVGGWPDDAASCLYPYESLGIAVAAVPFLQESVLRKSVSGQTFEDRTALIRQGIRECYQQLATLHQEQFAHLGLIGMGHLHVNGAQTSESERDIHIVGNLAAFETENFPSGYAYMALGHIHKPQKLSPIVRYSGSPIPLSFSERNDTKYVIELEFEGGKLLESHAIRVPTYRELRTFSGTLEEVRNLLTTFQPTTQLETLVEVDVVEPYHSPQLSMDFDILLKDFSDSSNFKIVKPRLTFLNRKVDAADMFEIGTEIEDLTPLQVFQKRIASEELEDETRVQLMDAFQELIGMLETNTDS